MKIYICAAVVLLLLYACNQNSNQQKTSTADSLKEIIHIPEQIQRNQMDSVILGFAEAYIIRNQKEANSYVHPVLGLTVIYRPGVSNQFVKIDSLDFSDPSPDYYPYPEISGQGKLIYAKLPTYDCAQECWSKLGFYCDTTLRPRELSGIVQFEREFEKNTYTQEDLDLILEAEASSYRIIMTTDNPLIFHIEKYQGNWYVTTLDRAYGGCDA